MIPSDDIYRMLVEVANGIPRSTSSIEASEEVTAFRDAVEREVAELRNAGYEMEVPHEIPDLTGTAPPNEWEDT